MIDTEVEADEAWTEAREGREARGRGIDWRKGSGEEE